MSAYGRKELEDTQITASRRMAANGVAVGCGLSIARVPIAGRALACADAACGARLLVARNSCARYGLNVATAQQLLSAMKTNAFGACAAVSAQGDLRAAEYP